MRRSLFSFILACLLCFPLAACGGEESPPPSAEAVLIAMQKTMTDTAQPLPDGLTYTRAVSLDHPAYLTDTFLSALYGEAARGLLDGTADEDGIPAVGDAATYLSVAPYPCELAVFRCSDIRTAATVAGLCRGRLDTVARGYEGSEWRSVAEGGRVSVAGCYVFLVIAEDAEAVIKGACRLVGE